MRRFLILFSGRLPGKCVHPGIQMAISKLIGSVWRIIVIVTEKFHRNLRVLSSVNAILPPQSGLRILQ